VDLSSEIECEFFANTIGLLKRHGLEQYAKNTSDQLTLKRIDGQDLTVCMNQRVIDEANTSVTLPHNTLSWDIVDIGEGRRTVSKNLRLYEEEIFNEIIAKVDELVGSLSRKM